MVVPDYAQVGCRVETRDGARATVRYVGSVVGQDGEWVGVEWDDPTRGKHDGSYGGTRYFECAATPADGVTPASFVRPLKIRPGVTFAEALRTKYLDGKTGDVASKRGDGDGDDDDDENDGGAYVRSANGQKVEIELCLKKDDPVAALAALDRVYLPDAGVVSAGSPGEAAGCGVSAARIRVLDLGGNLMTDWSAVARFGEEFPALTDLDLSGVRAAWPTSPPPSPSPFPNLAVLLLNKSGCSWASAAAVAAALPALRELSLADCGIATLGEGEGACSAAGFEGLRALNLEKNDLEEWGEVERLAHFPALERLHLGGNKLRRVAYPARKGAPDGPVPFETLSGLFLANNAIDEWESVDALNDFPAVSEVRLTGNPVTASAATRHEIVARVGRLSQLNGSLIADQERKDAEIRYLRRVLGLVKTAEGASGEGAGAAEGETRAPQTGSEAVAASHPRLQALLGSYGELSTHVTRATGTGKMSEDMLQLTLVCVAASAGERAPQTKKVPMSITVGKLKLLCEKLFKVRADVQRLFYKEPFQGMPELLEPDDYDISYLGVRDGASILVEEE